MFYITFVRQRIIDECSISVTSISLILLVQSGLRQAIYNSLLMLRLPVFVEKIIACIYSGKIGGSSAPLILQ